MVKNKKYNLGNIDGLIFKFNSIIYLIKKDRDELQYLNAENNSSFPYKWWEYCVGYLNSGYYEVIEKENKIIELW